jgi:hypothetical protein
MQNDRNALKYPTFNFTTFDLVEMPQHSAKRQSAERF